ncbi:MAG: hypothetical protein HON98_11040 [Chloroflexi bacterium]|jgi:hypothetical protein|nr:hypothetical protein [Chloroflexota bacterium]MBT3670512.1 hypothetical protein [Chloroflexota bacterium]MBT4003730.1 hypothetical protein [Chloroflexota bacterium]MBT4306496.1 hypothetical protein [Chloroflexota bacterium]MBT4534899.1 hypothetical protein [Chloroflexota bacterium]
MAEVIYLTEALVNSTGFDQNINIYHITEYIHKQRMEVAKGQNFFIGFARNVFARKGQKNDI